MRFVMRITFLYMLLSIVIHFSINNYHWTLSETIVELDLLLTHIESVLTIRFVSTYIIVCGVWG